MSQASPRLHSRRYPSSLYLDHSHFPVLAPATLAALPSTRAIPNRDVFYVADPISSIASRPHCKHLPRMTPGFGPGLVIPDLWQQEGVRALQQGKDVVVQSPTGSGKTYIFELLYPNLKTQAVFTVPTRALANDKLSEWRVRGWDVGISTGDVALNLDAKVVVATLETQRGRFLRGEGPGLLVMDEFQMLGDPLRLTPAQEATAGKSLTKLLRNRVAYHHSGLSYAARAGVVESLAKAGQLNVVVATMGLAAGINFSMRSVIVTDRRYFAGNFERQVEADELLQMFGRAGRRGLDEVGYALYTDDLPRLSDARARQLRRAAQVDWPSLISVMHAAAERGDPPSLQLRRDSSTGEEGGRGGQKSEVSGQQPDQNPFAAAMEVTRSLFSVQQVPLGVEHSLETGPRPCGFWVTDERARFVRRGVTEMLNSRDEWEPRPPAETATLGIALVRENPESIRGWRRSLA